MLKVAGQVLESGNWSCRKSQDSREGKNKRNVDSENEGQSLLSHQPFLSLVLTCLKGQDDQRESLLSSLHSQLSQFLSMSKDVSIHIHIRTYKYIRNILLFSGLTIIHFKTRLITAFLVLILL